MSKDRPYPITEWEWFILQLQLDLTSLKHDDFYFRTEARGITKERPLKLLVSHVNTARLVNNKETKDEQEKFYRYLHRWAKDVVRRNLELVPSLEKDFDFNKDVEFGILYDYGKTAYVVCRFVGEELIWS